MGEISRPVIILLVEDNPADALLISEALSEGKMRQKLYVTADGSDALRFLAKQANYAKAPRPDIILLDLNLPGRSGLEVLLEIKSSPGLRAIPVIVLTSSQSEEDIARSYSLHANCFITKPVSFDRYLEVMESIEDFWFGTVRLPPREK